MHFKRYRAGAIILEIPDSYNVQIWKKESSYYIKNKGKCQIDFLIQTNVSNEYFDACISMLEQNINYTDQGVTIRTEINEALNLPRIGRFKKGTAEREGVGKYHFTWRCAMVCEGINIDLSMSSDKDYTDIVRRIIYSIESSSPKATP